MVKCKRSCTYKKVRGSNIIIIIILIRYLGPNGRPEIDESANNNKCPVCHEKAGKHSYYGGRVCPSCRAFFRRAVQSK